MKVIICIGSSCHLKGSRQIVERLQALGPVAALRTRPLRPGEAVDAAVDAPGGFPPALETLAWLLFDDALTLEHVGRHAAHVWAKTARFAPRGAPSGTAR